MSLGSSNIPKKLPLKNITMGNFHVSETPVELRTILGSCIAACVRDPEVKVGGMNHFLLPGKIDMHEVSAQYGLFAMELLINEILGKGGLKSRLEVKIFGGANVIKSSTRVGSMNSEFIKDYLRTESLSITTEDLGGILPRKICYFPETGKVLLKKIREKSGFIQVNKEEGQYVHKLEEKPEAAPVASSEDIELF